MKIYFKKYLSILLVLIGIIMFLALLPILKALYVDADFAISVRLFIFIVFPLPILIFTCRFILVKELIDYLLILLRLNLL